MAPAYRRKKEARPRSTDRLKYRIPTLTFELKNLWTYQLRLLPKRNFCIPNPQFKINTLHINGIRKGNSEVVSNPHVPEGYYQVHEHNCPNDHNPELSKFYRIISERNQGYWQPPDSLQLFYDRASFDLGRKLQSALLSYYGRETNSSICYILSRRKRSRRRYIKKKPKSLCVRPFTRAKASLLGKIATRKPRIRLGAISNEVNNDSRLSLGMNDQSAKRSIKDIPNIAKIQSLLAKLPFKDWPDFVQQSPQLTNFFTQSRGVDVSSSRRSSSIASQSPQQYDETALELSIKQMTTIDPASIKQYLDRQIAAAKNQAFTASQEAMIQSCLNIRDNNCPQRNTNGIENMPRLHLDMSQKRAVIARTVDPGNSGENRTQLLEFAAPVQNLQFDAPNLNLPLLPQLKEGNHANRSNFRTTSIVAPEMLQTSWGENKKRRKVDHTSFHNHLGETPAMDKLVTDLNTTRGRGQARNIEVNSTKKPCTCPLRRIPPVPEKRDVCSALLHDRGEIRFLHSVTTSLRRLSLEQEMLENKEQTYNEEKEINTYSPKSLEPLPFDPDYQGGIDETSPDGLMSIRELEDAFEKDRHHEPLPNDCEHLTVPLIECQEYLTEGYGTKERPISPQSKRRRVSPDGDLEQQQLPRIDQDSAGLDPPTATSIATSTTMDEDSDPDSPSFSDIDLFMDSEDEVSLVRNAGPSARRISLSVTRESQATVKITYPATGLNATSNMQAADAPALSISQVPQGSVDFSSTKRTLSPTNIVSHVSHSDPSAGFSVSSLSGSSFAAMSLNLNLDNDMSIAASDNLTAPSSFSAVNMEDVVMIDQFNDSQVTSVPEAGDVSTIHEPRGAFFQVEPDEPPILSSQNTSGYGLADKHSATDAAVASAPSISEQPIMPAPKPTDRITGEYGFADKHSTNIASVHSSDDGSPLVNPELASSSLPAADIPALRDADLESTPTEAGAQDQTHIFSPLAPTGQNPKLVSPSLFSLAGFQVTPNTKTCPLCNKTYKHHGYLVNHIRQCQCKTPATAPSAQISSSVEESPGPGNYSCTKCSKSYRKRGNFENHKIKCNATTPSPQIHSVKQLPSISETYTGTVVLPDREASDKMGRPVCTACGTAVSSRNWLYRHIDNTCKVLRAHGVYYDVDQMQNMLRSSQTLDASNQSQNSSNQSFSFAQPLSPAAFVSKDTESVVSSSVFVGRKMSGSMPLPANISATKRGPFNLSVSIQEPSTSSFDGSYVSHSGNHRSNADTMPHPGTCNGPKNSTMSSFSFLDNDATNRVDDPDSDDADEDEVSIRQEYSASPTPAGKKKRDFNSSSTHRCVSSASGLQGSEPLQPGPSSIEKILASSNQPVAGDLNGSLFSLGLGANKTPCQSNSHRRRLFTDRIRSNPPPLDSLSDPFKDSPLGKPRNKSLDFDTPHAAKKTSPSPAIDPTDIPVPKSSPLRSPNEAQLIITFPHARSCNSNLKLFEKFIKDAGADSSIEMSCPDERILFLKAPKGTDLVTVARNLLPNKLVAEERSVLRFDPAAARKGTRENGEKEDVPRNNTKKQARTSTDQKEEKPENNIKRPTRDSIVEKEEKPGSAPVKGRERGWNLKNIKD